MMEMGMATNNQRGADAAEEKEQHKNSQKNPYQSCVFTSPMALLINSPDWKPDEAYIREAPAECSPWHR